MPRLDRTGIGTVGVAVASIVAAFVIATVTPMVRIDRIRADAEAITDNAVPSIEELVGARRAISRIRLAFERAEVHAANGVSWIELQSAVDGLRGHVQRYLALPPFAGEREHWTEVRESLAGIDGVMQAITATEHTTDLAAIGPLLAAALERADAVLLATIESNAEQIRAFTRHIEDARAKSRRDALLLIGASLILAGALLVWSVRTLRQRHAAEKVVQELLAARAAELDQFAARVAHDLVSPLTPAALWLEQLQESPDDRTRHAASRGLRGIERTRRIVEGLLAFARAGRVVTAPARSDVEAVARAVVADLEETRVEANASLELLTDLDGERVLLHEGVLASILTNLIDNALKYLGDAAVRRVTVRATRAGDRVRLEVEDTGPGIPPELQARIFEPYFRAAPDGNSGLGLGLATVKRLVEAHRGRIGVSSSEGGSTFWVELPAT